MLGSLSGGELAIIFFIAVVLIGPQNLPRYAEQLANFVRQAKAFVTNAASTLKQEMGAEDLDLSQFDLRQYDPRRIVRDALTEDTVLAKPKPAAKRPAAEAAVAAPVAAPVAAATATVASVSASTTSEISGHSAQSHAGPTPAEVAVNFDDQAT